VASVLILSFSPLRSDPRVARQVRWLHGHHRVTSCGFGPAPDGAAAHIEIHSVPRGPLARIAALVPLKLGRYDWYYWSHPRVRLAREALRTAAPELVVANDLATLPLALEVARGAPVVFDAHEFAPLEYEDQRIWRFFLARFNDQMCRRYVPRARRAITVCRGIAERYERDYGVAMEVVTNAAPSRNLPVRPTSQSAVRLIHHGAAIHSRRIELMIELMALLDERFSLDLILVPGDVRYIARLRRMAEGNPRVRFLERVPMEQLVEVSAQYDIGLFLLPPTNFNYAMALPNKFFEFIQARLAVAIGPSPEMARIVREFDCGVVADDFEPASLARLLNGLTAADIDRMKAGSDRASLVHNAESNAEILRRIVASALEGQT
jgi:glycosyltransferase involved in cell wall biosynthesis